jgi:16S rRNA (guanine527-N7)-methyltransferase
MGIEIIVKYFPHLSSTQKEQLALLQPLYEDWNERINVISRKDIHQLYERHVLHSLSIARFISFLPNTHVADLGTGGGFPGIPLAILFPETSFLLIDSIAKKIKVVEAVAHSLQLQNVHTLQARAEEIKNKNFDFTVSRAVASLKELWQWSKPLLKKNSKHTIKNGLICLKGGDLSVEIFQSQLHPSVIPIETFFEESFFSGKYLLHVAI